MIRIMKKQQMSESVFVAAFLCLSGGFQDAYTFFYRGEVFANAQTGNMVLMGTSFATGDYRTGMRYLLPVLAFATGIYVAERIRRHFKYYRKIHWRQLIVIMEILFFVRCRMDAAKDGSCGKYAGLLCLRYAGTKFP